MTARQEMAERIASKVTEMLEHPDVEVAFESGLFYTVDEAARMEYAHPDGSFTITVKTPPTVTA